MDRRGLANMNLHAPLLCFGSAIFDAPPDDQNRDQSVGRGQRPFAQPVFWGIAEASKSSRGEEAIAALRVVWMEQRIGRSESLFYPRAVAGFE
jgi:hypothetical protein